MQPKNMKEEILKTLEEMGEDWVVAAMVEGSIGYHSPTFSLMYPTAGV